MKYRDEGVVSKACKIRTVFDVKAVAKGLNRSGFRTRHRSSWRCRSIHKILTNSVYHGAYLGRLHGVP